MHCQEHPRDTALSRRPAGRLVSLVGRAWRLAPVLLLLGTVAAVTAVQAQTPVVVPDQIPVDGDLRLVDGTVPSEGRVELYHVDSHGEGRWGTVCDDYWLSRNANVVCRQLGYERAQSAHGGGHFGVGSGPIWLDDVRCQGSEDHLLDCRRYRSPAIGEHNCNHYEDAGVTCDATSNPRIAIRSRTLQVTEEDTVGAAYTVVLRTPPNGRVVVEVSVPDGSELAASPSSLTFTTDDWKQGRSVTVTAGSDADAFDDTGVLTHTAVGGGYDAAAAVEVRVEVRDNDIVPLTAEFGDLPQNHNGWAPFKFRLDFNQAIETSFATIRDAALQVSGGGVKSVKRVDPSSNRSWEVFVEPKTWGELTITLLAIRRCTDPRALCTANGDPLSAAVEQSVAGPPLTTEPRYRPGDLRLVNGSVPWQGRVEMFYASEDVEGEWGTVCDNSWDIQDAHAACRQLGYPRALEAHGEARFGAGSGPIWLGGLRCGMSDSRLLDCRRWDSLPVDRYCRHSEDAGVTCDTAGVEKISVTPGVLRVVEGDPAGAAYDIALLAQPSSPVTVTIEGTAGTDVTATPLSLTFTTENWYQPQSVTVTAAGDADAATDTASLSHRASGDYEGMLAAFVAVTVQDDDVAPTTARFLDVPETHDGSSPFSFELRFSQDLSISYRTVRDSVLEVTGGRVTRARRIERPRNRRWRITIEPHTAGDVTVVLPGDRECGETGAVCTENGENLAPRIVKTIAGPSSTRALTVMDARAREGADATVDFAVTLSPPPVRMVTVDWVTVDGTARAGEDYTGATGTLSFASGETQKTVSVTVLDDATDEGEETFTLRLSNPSGAVFGDNQATGTITNDDPMPKAWLARFGSIVAGQAVDAIGDRMKGGGGSRAVVGGVPLKRTDGLAEATIPVEERIGLQLTNSARHGDGLRPMTERELLRRSSFRLETGGGHMPTWTAWGEVKTGRFEADRKDVGMDGEVTSGFLGIDASRGRWLAGLAIGLSAGEGSFELVRESRTLDAGKVKSRLASLYPYLRYGIAEHTGVWGMLGAGSGRLTLIERADENRETDVVIRTDLAMRMGALGVQGRLLSPAAAGGLALGFRSDVFWARVDADVVRGSAGNLAGSQADVSRLRLIIEASRELVVGDGTLTPSLELGARRDGGDAATGTGLEVGGGLRYAGAGVTVQGSVRALVAHAESGYEEWGASGAVRIDPGASGRGWSLAVAPSWGAASSETARLWSRAETRAFLRDRGFEAGRRLDAELGYGMGLGPARGVLTPFAGLSLGDGGRIWRAGARWRIEPGARLTLEGSREQGAADETPVDALMLHGSLRF